MIGVTVATSEWMEMAEEAARRWNKHTGLPAKIIEVADRREVRTAKLSLSEECWFFDSDLWFIRDVQMPTPRGDCVIGTPVVPSQQGREIIQGWAMRAGVDPACWISGGLYGANWNEPIVRKALQLARAHAEEWEITDRDEEPLNVGLQRAGVLVGLLPSAYNWHPRCGAGYGYTPPEGIIAIHAGDVRPEEKFEFLKEHTGEQQTR